MSSSGLIYAAIVGLWAAYLVPMWLRRQDELAESGSQDRIFTAMRVLARRPATAPAEDDSGLDLDPRERRRQRRSAAKAQRAARAAAQRASRRRAALLARRRRVVSVLFLTFTAGSALTAAYGQVWVGVPAVTGLLLSLYIVYLRARERRRAELLQRKRRVETGARRQRGAGLAGRIPASRSAPAHAAGEWEDGADTGDTWDPVPVPLPTYVTAPVAPGTPMWSYQPPGTAARDRDGDTTATGTGPAVYDQYSDLDDRPRAVND